MPVVKKKNECQHCGKIWFSFPSKIALYCSHKCYSKSKKGKVQNKPAVYRKCYGIKIKEKRACLRCGKSFFSYGIWNRICISCKDLNHETLSVYQVDIKRTFVSRSVWEC